MSHQTSGTSRAACALLLPLLMIVAAVASATDARAAARLTNVSTRGYVGTGENVLIGGFIVQGTTAKRVLVRAIGPTLADYGVANVLANPVVTLFDSSQVNRGSNDDWRAGRTAEEIQQIVDTGLAPPRDAESCILIELPPGAYTAIVTGSGGGVGVGLVEAYAVDALTTSWLANVSTRAVVGTGAEVLIGGFIVGGDAPLTTAVRAIGPTLGSYGVQGVLPNPKIELYSGPTRLGSNDDWDGGSQGYAIERGALAPPDGLESVFLATLPSGPYTAIVSGSGGQTGVGLVEAYELDRASTCRNLAFTADLAAAEDCLDGEPSPASRLLRAVTLLPASFDQQREGDVPGAFTDSWKEMLDQLGVSPDGRTVFGFTAQLPDPLPTDSPTGGDAQEFLETVVVAQLDASLALLEPLCPGFALVLDQQELAELGIFDRTSVELDCGDVKLLQSALLGLRGTMLAFLLAQDLDLDVDEVAGLDLSRIQENLLDPNPSFLTLRTGAAATLAAARSSMTAAIDAYYAASNFIRNLDDPNPADDLVTIDPADLPDEYEQRVTLGETRCSLAGAPLTGITDVTAICGSGAPSISGAPVDLSPFFDGDFGLREVLPPFAYDAYCGQSFVDTSTPAASFPFPDPTIGGTFPGQTQSELIDALGLYPRVEAWAWFYPFAAPWDLQQWFYVASVGDGDAPRVEILGLGLADGAHFRIDPDPSQIGFPMPLCAGEWAFATVVFDPPSGQGIVADELVIETNDPSQPEIRIPLVGCTGPSYDCDNDGVWD